MDRQRKQIRQFIKNMSSGAYKNAHTDLKNIVEDKLKLKIKKAYKKDLF